MTDLEPAAAAEPHFASDSSRDFLEAGQLVEASERRLAQGDVAAAKQAAESAREAFIGAPEAEAQTGEVLAVLALARACLVGGEAEQALTAAKEAQTLAQQAGSQKEEGDALIAIAHAHMAGHEGRQKAAREQGQEPDQASAQGVHREALSAALGALALHRKVKYERGQANALYMVAQSHLVARDGDAAARFAIQAHNLFKGVGDVQMQGCALLTLADAHRMCDRLDEAGRSARGALECARQSGDTFGAEGAARLLAFLKQAKEPQIPPEALKAVSNAPAGSIGSVVGGGEQDFEIDQGWLYSTALRQSTELAEGKVSAVLRLKRY